MTNKKLMNVRELSEYLSMPKATLYTYVSLGKIPQQCIVRIGKALKFDVEEIEKWITSLKSENNIY